MIGDNCILNENHSGPSLSLVNNGYMQYISIVGGDNGYLAGGQKPGNFELYSITNKECINMGCNTNYNRMWSKATFNENYNQLYIGGGYREDHVARSVGGDV